MSDKTLSQKRKKIIILCTLCILTVCGITLFFYFRSWETLKKDDKAQMGLLPGMTEEQVREEMDRKVDESMFAIGINSRLEFEDGKSEGLIRIENSPGNHYRMQVEMYRKDNDELIYQSGMIAPGAYIEKDKLDVELKKGEYPVKVIFHAYHKEQEDHVGQAELETLVIIKN